MVGDKYERLLHFLLNVQVYFLHIVEEGYVEFVFALLDFAIEELQILYQSNLWGQNAVVPEMWAFSMEEAGVADLAVKQSHEVVEVVSDFLTVLFKSWLNREEVQQSLIYLRQWLVYDADNGILTLLFHFNNLLLRKRLDYF
jgi:hypothetical protein